MIFIQTFLVLICTSFLSGYFLLKIFGLNLKFSNLETLVLSYVLSFIFTSFITLISLIMPNSIKPFIFLTTLLALGCISLIKKTSSIVSRPKSFTRNIDFFALIFSVIFYCVSFYIMYPGFSQLLGTDISRHYSYSVILGRTPELYVHLGYLFSHLFENMFFSLSSGTVSLNQSVLVTLNLILPISFYVLAKRSLEYLDKRLPSLTTLFWVLFTNLYGGFTWIFFISQKFSGLYETQFQILNAVSDQTLYGTIYAIFGLWYYPNSIALGLILVGFFLMYTNNLSRIKYVSIFSLLTCSLYLTYSVGGVFFCLFLAFYAIFSGNNTVKVNDSIISSIIGCLGVLGIYAVFLLLIDAHIVLTSSFWLSLFLPPLALTFSFVFRKIKSLNFPKISFKLKSNKKNFINIIFILIIFLYVVSFLTWVSINDTFHTEYFAKSGLIPWFLYPLILGINGLLMINSLPLIANNKFSRISVFVYLIVFTITFGALISFVNLNLFQTSYFERRLLVFLKVGLALFAPIPILFLSDKLKMIKIHFKFKIFLSILLVAFVVVYGISSSFLNLEYWNLVANNPDNQFSSTDIDGINSLREILNNDPEAWVATVTQKSADSLIFAAPADTLGYRHILYNSQTSEETLTLLYRHPSLSHPYLYLHQRDFNYLQNFNSYLFNYLLPVVPKFFEDSYVTIYNFSKVTPPTPISNTVLVIPDDEINFKDKLSFCHNILSQSLINYTVAFDSDEQTLENAENIILPYDPPENNMIISEVNGLSNQTTEEYWSVISGNWEFEDGNLLIDNSEKLSEGLLLSSISVENFTLSTSFTIDDLDNSLNNHVGFIYSWENLDNYRIALLRILPDGSITALIRVIQDGELSIWNVLPYEPGVQSGFSWTSNEEYELKLTVQGERNSISIDGKEILNVTMSPKKGNIGFYYLRPYLIKFNGFHLNGTKISNFKTSEYYLDFASSGKNLIILNTNDFNAIGELLFESFNATSVAQTISGSSKSIELPFDLELPITTTNGNPISHYESPDNIKVPFAVEKNEGEGKIIYLNIFPLLSYESNDAFIYPIMGDLLNIKELNLSLFNMTPIIKENSGYVKEIKLESANISTVFMSGTPSSDVKISIIKNGNSIELKEVSEFVLSSSRVTIIADDVVINDGVGFYSNININGTFTLNMIPSDSKIEFKTSNGKQEFSEVSQLTFYMPKEMEVTIRNPTINASKAIFNEVYVGLFSNKLNVWGETAITQGNTSFKILLSDSYQMLEFIEIPEEIFTESLESVVDFNYYNIQGILISLIILPLFLLLSLFMKRGA